MDPRGRRNGDGARGVAMLKKALSRSEVARELGSSISSVLSWREAFEEGGSEALSREARPGPAKETGRT